MRVSERPWSEATQAPLAEVRAYTLTRSTCWSRMKIENRKSKIENRKSILEILKTELF
jgi:hypothetical protein